MERIERLRQLLKQKSEIDAELKTIRQQLSGKREFLRTFCC